MDDSILRSTDHRGLKLQNIIQKLSEHCDIKNPAELDTAIDEDDDGTETQRVSETKRKKQNTSDICGLNENGSSSVSHHLTTEKRREELNSDSKLKCCNTEYDQQSNDSCKASSVLPRERISARIRSLKSKKVAYEEQDWVDPDQIRLSGKKIPVQSNKNPSQDDNANTGTQKRKRRKKQTVQSMEDYVNEAPLIQVGNLVGLRQCCLCAVMFVEKEQLINHMKAVHHLDDKINTKREATETSQNEDKMTDEKPFKCSQCESSFRKSSGLKQHVTRQHSQNTPQKSSQSSSRRGAHSNDRPYACQVCGKAFKRKHHLQEHSYIHSDEKPYKCDTCSKTFNQRICLTKHLPCREHEKQQRKPSCTTTGNTSVLEQHQSQVTDKLTDNKAAAVSCAETSTASSVAKSVSSTSSLNSHADHSEKPQLRSQVNGTDCDGKIQTRDMSNGDHSAFSRHTTNAVDSQDSMADGNKMAISYLSPNTAATVNGQPCPVKKPAGASVDETQRGILKQQN